MYRFLVHQIKNLEAQVTQQLELQHCLEQQLDAALEDRDRLEEELAAVHESGRGGVGGGIAGLTLDEGDEDDSDEEGDDEDGNEA